MPSSSRIERFERNTRFQPTEKLSKRKVCAKYKALSLGPFICTYLHSGYISGLMIWQPCKYNWDCATLMGVLSYLRVLTWSY